MPMYTPDCWRYQRLGDMQLELALRATQQGAASVADTHKRVARAYYERAARS